jgi:NADPH2 dehydrogenase
VSTGHVKLATLRDAAAFRAAAAALGAALPCDETILPAPDSPLAQPICAGGLRLRNRWCIQPMEGWDGTTDGLPTELTRRRWQRFGGSGAALLWGCEAVAVLPEGRANPNQLLLNEHTAPALAALRRELVEAHAAACGTTDGLAVGLQLTHSGRYCRPHRKDLPEPLPAFHHPILDRRLGLAPGDPLLSDTELERIIAAFGNAALLAQQAGFDFVDLKHCHGYLAHELLGAHTRPGPFGGSFANRTRFLRETAAAVRRRAPHLALAVRLSFFDLAPYQPDPARSSPGNPGPGIPELPESGPYVFGFGVNPREPREPDLREPLRFLDLLRELDIRLVNLTAGSPYYNPHIQRPAAYPPSDGYRPPEDPLLGCARQIAAVRAARAHAPDLVYVGSGYSYLQEFLPQVAQALVREGSVDLVGLGRMALSYPELPRDVLEQGRLRTRLLCRTFSDCTTAPRNGLVSGCYPLDPHYRNSPARAQLELLKRPRGTG